MALVALVVHIAARLVTAFAFNYFMFVAGRLLTSIVDIAWYSALYVFGEYHFRRRYRIRVLDLDVALSVSSAL